MIKYKEFENSRHEFENSQKRTNLAKPQVSMNKLVARGIFVFGQKEILPNSHSLVIVAKKSRCLKVGNYSCHIKVLKFVSSLWFEMYK